MKWLLSYFVLSLALLFTAQEPARFDASTSWAEAVKRLQRVFRQRLRALDKLQFVEELRNTPLGVK